MMAVSRESGGKAGAGKARVHICVWLSS
jgi:hypothetical protein